MRASSSCVPWRCWKNLCRRAGTATRYGNSRSTWSTADLRSRRTESREPTHCQEAIDGERQHFRVFRRLVLQEDTGSDKLVFSSNADTRAKQAILRALPGWLLASESELIW